MQNRITVDIVVVGAGHAGCEAALAAARLGCRTAVFTMNLDAVANLPCNPSIGGTAKGHLVREIDALGGEMARAADACCLQSRMLNRGKGPAVHSLRMQIDRRAYSARIKHTLETQPNLLLKQAEIVDLNKTASGWQAVTNLGAVYQAKAVIIATGTYLGGRIYVGDVNYAGGPDGLLAANRLGESLLKLNLPLRRFKTGTPARVNRRSVDFTGLEPQCGDEPPEPFSFETGEGQVQNTRSCYITYTNNRTKKIVLENLHRSPLFSGEIQGVGPRYCPSIEDKIVRFADKERHQIFIEPCGADTDELYLQGMSSSLPEDVQIQVMGSIKGLERAEIMRTAYAIEYDCVDPIALDASLMVKEHPGLYGAGQFNGSSGYEEAAAQGLIAGINAARMVKQLPPVMLERSSSYIGTLIDDLVTKGCSDPYRMMTSRSEYRLVLRQDNADTRLMPLGREIGLIGDCKWQAYLQRKEEKERERARCAKTVLPPTEKLNALLVSRGTSPVVSGVTLENLLKRPQVDYQLLAELDPGRPHLSRSLLEQVETEIKYEGYIKRQQAAIAEQRRLEVRKLPKDMDYRAISGLRLEAREKLTAVQPRNIGQAARISGVSPADISVLIIEMERRGQNAAVGTDSEHGKAV